MSYNIEQIKKQTKSFDGLNANEIKGLLITKYKVPFSDIPKVYKSLGFVTANVSYTQVFYDMLKSKPMDDKTFTAWIEAGTKNRKAHAKHFDAIRSLANDIHADK